MQERSQSRVSCTALESMTGQPEAILVNAEALFPASARYLRYGQRNESWGTRVYVPLDSYAAVYVRVQEGRSEQSTSQPSASMKGPRPTRFTTLSCNYHHKVDFTSSKSPRKGMLHFVLAHPSLPGPFRRPSGYTTYGKPPWPPLGHSLLRFTLRPTVYPFHSTRRYPSTASGTLKPAEGYLLLAARPRCRCRRSLVHRPPLEYRSIHDACAFTSKETMRNNPVAISSSWSSRFKS